MKKYKWILHIQPLNKSTNEKKYKWILPMNKYKWILPINPWITVPIKNKNELYQWNP